MSHKFITNEHYLNVQKILTGHEPAAVSLLNNKMFGVLAFIAVISAILAIFKKIPNGLFYFYHIGVHIIWFMSLLLGRLLPGKPTNLNPPYEAVYDYFVRSSLLTFLFVFIVGGLLVSAIAFAKKRFASLPVRGIYHSIGAGAVGFLAMIVLNPFHLTNLTHTFEISVSKHAESWRQVNEWKPAFDFMDKTTSTPNPVGDEEWFGVLCILTGVVFVVWLIGYFMKPHANQKTFKRSRSEPEKPDTSVRPKVFLSLIVISFLTIYMAIRSRRFIAIAGSAACPIVALLMFQAWQMFIAKIQFGTKDPSSARSTIPAIALPHVRVVIIRVVIILSLTGLAVFWGAKYKRVYLEPWLADATYNSVFMRMTASHLKPIEACEFIRRNKLSGRIFNYWTEGGAVALGQQPDPETGEIPLKVFMDGRAQAAYNHETFELWQNIFSGGPVARQAMLQGQKLTKADYRKIAQWINSELRKRNVWVTLMPISQDESTFMKALKTSESWKTAYRDDIQHMLVDTQSPRGAALINQISEGTAVFPTDYSKSLTTFHVITENRIQNRYSELYSFAKKAFERNPSPASAIQLMKLQSPAGQKDISHFLDDFVENKDTYENKDGYLQRLSTATIAAQYLAGRNAERKQHYVKWKREFERESKTLKHRQIW